jgi:hypothetical protein
MALPADLRAWLTDRAAEDPGLKYVAPDTADRRLEDAGGLADIQAGITTTSTNPSPVRVAPFWLNAAADQAKTENCAPAGPAGWKVGAPART